MARKIYLIPENGLGNRLFAITSAVRVAHQTNRDLVVIRRDDESLSGSLTKLLGLNLAEIPIESVEKEALWRMDNPVRLIGGRSFYFENGIADVIVKGWHHFLLTENDLAMLQSDGEAARLKIEKDLRATCRYLLQQNYVPLRYDAGIHIRTSTGIRDKDHMWHIPDLRQLLPNIVNAFEKWDVKTVYLSSSDELFRHIISDHLKMYNILVVNSQSHNYDNSITALTQAIYDFRSLLNSAKIIRAPLSTFSALPSFINGDYEAVYQNDGSLSIRTPSLMHGFAL